MTKQSLKIILLAAAISFFFQLFFGRSIAATVSTWPMLNRFNILSPQTPIVINKREQVRVSDSGEAREIVQSFKSRVSLLLEIRQGQVVPLGSAINLTGEGLVGVTKEQLKTASGELRVLGNDGRIGKISQQVADPSSELVLLQTDLKNLPVVSLGRSDELLPGDKIFLVAGSVRESTAKFLASFVSEVQDDFYSRVLNADTPGKSFQLQQVLGMASGQAAVNSKGELAGILHAEGIVPSDQVRVALNSYLADSKKISRPIFGFTYSMLSEVEGQMLGLVPGAIVREVTVNSPALKAGLQKNDIITKAGDTDFAQGGILEDVLYRLKPGDKLDISVVRNRANISLTLITGEKAQ